MTKNKIELTYFQPRPGQEATSISSERQLPHRIIDIFYLRPTPTTPAELVVVIGCLMGGALLVATGPTLATLPATIRTQLQTLQVSQRSLFRTFTANELSIFSLEAIEQQPNIVGFNDAVTLFGRLQARLGADGGPVQVTPFACEGQVTVGRLDVLTAYQAALPYVFLNPETQQEKMYHFLLPGAPWQTITQGRGAVLVYPLLTAEVAHRFDNTVFTMRIAYDLLIRLQQELTEAGMYHPFTKYNLPVPSRLRLERELTLEHYTIQGDLAIKQNPQTPQEDATAQSWLAHLRRLAQRWSAPKLWLPPQATPEVYHDLIVEILPAVTRPEDQMMAQALAQLLTAPALNKGEAPVADATPARTPEPVQPALAQPPVVKPPIGQPPSVGKPPGRTAWADDFATSAAEPASSSQPKWWADFPTAEQPSSKRLLTTNEDDGSAALDNEQATSPEPPAAPPAKADQADWSQDFTLPTAPESPAAPPSAAKWRDDFA